MAQANRFLSRERILAVVKTLLPGMVGGVVAFFGSIDPAQRHFSFFQFFVAARTGGILGAVVACFAFIFPGAEDKFSRWMRWGLASLVVGAAGGAVTAMLWSQGALHPKPEGPH